MNLGQQLTNTKMFVELMDSLPAKDTLRTSGVSICDTLIPGVMDVVVGGNHLRSLCKSFVTYRKRPSEFGWVGSLTDVLKVQMGGDYHLVVEHLLNLYPSRLTAALTRAETMMVRDAGDYMKLRAQRSQMMRKWHMRAYHRQMGLDLSEQMCESVFGSNHDGINQWGYICGMATTNEVMLFTGSELPTSRIWEKPTVAVIPFLSDFNRLSYLKFYGMDDEVFIWEEENGFIRAADSKILGSKPMSWAGLSFWRPWDHKGETPKHSFPYRVYRDPFDAMLGASIPGNHFPCLLGSPHTSPNGIHFSHTTGIMITRPGVLADYRWVGNTHRSGVFDSLVVSEMDKHQSHEGLDTCQTACDVDTYTARVIADTLYRHTPESRKVTYLCSCLSPSALALDKTRHILRDYQMAHLVDQMNVNVKTTTSTTTALSPKAAIIDNGHKLSISFSGAQPSNFTNFSFHVNRSLLFERNPQDMYYQMELNVSNKFRHTLLVSKSDCSSPQRLIDALQSRVTAEKGTLLPEYIDTTMGSFMLKYLNIKCATAPTTYGNDFLGFDEQFNRFVTPGWTVNRHRMDKAEWLPHPQKGRLSYFGELCEPGSTPDDFLGKDASKLFSAVVAQIAYFRLGWEVEPIIVKDTQGNRNLVRDVFACFGQRTILVLRKQGGKHLGISKSQVISGYPVMGTGNPAGAGHDNMLLTILHRDTNSHCGIDHLPDGDGMSESQRAAIVSLFLHLAQRLLDDIDQAQRAIDKQQNASLSEQGKQIILDLLPAARGFFSPSYQLRHFCEWLMDTTEDMLRNFLIEDGDAYIIELPNDLKFKRQILTELKGVDKNADSVGLFGIRVSKMLLEPVLTDFYRQTY